MADEQANSAPAFEPTEKELTEAQLELAIGKAMADKDLKLVISLARDLDKLTKANASAKQEEKLAALIDITTKVRKAVEKLIDGLVAGKELDLADGLWITWDFEAVREVGINPSVRLVKTTKTRKSSGTGGGQRFSIGWKDLLEKHGGSPYKDSGLTCQQKWDESSEKNSRYQVRMAMLKLDGQV